MFDKQRIDDAVSPVVGVILMVAVTVILAAVIGSFVLDLGNNVQANPQAGVTFDQSTDEVNVQVVSMENADEVIVQFDGSNSTMDGVGQTVTIGDGGDISVSDLEGGDQVTVIGVLDGKRAVLQTYTYDGA